MSADLRQRILNSLPTNIRQPLNDLFASGAEIVNDTVGNVTGDVTGNVAGSVLDASENYFATGGTTVPVSGTAGYAFGCMFIKSNAALGQCPRWINIGTATSCLFVPDGPVIAYGVAAAGGEVLTAGGDATETILLPGVALVSDISFAEYCVTNDTDTVVSQINTAQLITLVGTVDPSTAHSIAWALLRSGGVPGYDIFAAGTRVAITGDTATIPITVAGVRAGDIAFATIIATDDTDKVCAVACSTNTVTITADADPVTDHTWSYVVLRPRGTFKPSHYVAYAGAHTTLGGAAAEAITVTGALATDIPIVHYRVSNDADTIVKAVLTANTLTVTTSADPLALHAFAYMILRAY